MVKDKSNKDKAYGKSLVVPKIFNLEFNKRNVSIDKDAPFLFGINYFEATIGHYLIFH